MTSLNEWKLHRQIDQMFPGERTDDCAYELKNATHYRLVSTDLLVEGVHFIRNLIDPRDLGMKALNVNLSDIAAMGGRPTGLYLSLALPHDLETSYVENFLTGLQAVAQSLGVELKGGDTSASRRDFFINILIEGEVELQNLRLRSQAQRGQLLCVTGTLGDSRMGLELLETCKRDYTSIEKQLIQVHCRAQAHLAQGQWLAQQRAVTTLMDVSDGLASDCKCLMQASNCGVRVDLEHLPLSRGLQIVSKERGGRPFEYAFRGGEDYVLLTCVEKSDFSELTQNFEKEFKAPLHLIGEILEPERGLELYFEGQFFNEELSAFEHFEKQ